MKDFVGKVAVITGGGTGIGAQLAIKLVQQGMKVVVASTNKEKLEAGAQTIREAGGDAAEVLPVVCDVSSRASVQNLFDVTIKTYGQVDLLVANSGVTTSGPFLDHREKDWDWVYDVVLKGTVYCIQIFYPYFCKQKSGHIVITGSQAGMVPDWFLDHGPYTSAKSAVTALGTALRPEAAQHGVGVTNVIVAGTITEIMKSERSRPAQYGDPLQVTIGKRSARRIEASEVAEMIVTGIKNDVAFVATHAELKAVTKDYFDRILSAYDLGSKPEDEEK